MVIVSGGIDISFGSTIGLCPLHWAYCFKVVCRCRWRYSCLTARRIVRVDQRRINYLYQINPLVITLGTLYLFAGSALLFPGWPERRGTKVLVDSRWRFRFR